MTSQLEVRPAVRQHGRRDYSVVRRRAPSSPLARVSAACR
jgi:hypothetical protein